MVSSEDFTSMRIEQCRRKEGRFDGHQDQIQQLKQSKCRPGRPEFGLRITLFTINPQ